MLDHLLYLTAAGRHFSKGLVQGVAELMSDTMARASSRLGDLISDKAG